ncbi:DinB family protein [uncultured Agitococcus sp.]|uniref:DinB family protein n=1 Tax=uncultured Agitococcus sp. TaxID=1506599 RepID=UPI002626DA83|nr:DinB family protein [uncultured Agitococcus sp.]
MNCQQYAIIMANYNQWMNQRLYQLVATLSDEQRKEDLGAFFGSIHHTLNHLLLGDQAWLQRFQGQPVTMKSPRDIVHDDFGLLQQARQEMDEQILAWAQALATRYDNEQLRFYSVTYQKEIVMPLFAAVMQFFNHQTHHRGQITTLLSQMNLDIGVTDLPVMPYFINQ